MTEATEPVVPDDERRKMTDEEAAAVLTLVRGGWLKLELIGDPA